MVQIHIKDLKELERALSSLSASSQSLETSIGVLNSALTRVRANHLDSKGRQFAASVEETLKTLRKAKDELDRQRIPELRSTVERARRMQE